MICLVWFDKKRKIYGEYPEVVEWIFDYAIPLFESWGYAVKVLESEKDYVYWFNHKIAKSSKPERIGKIAGWLIGGMCAMNREKVQPIRKFLKMLNEPYIEYIGIAADEKVRLERAHKKNQISLLEKYGIAERDTYDILRPYNLLSPTYSYTDRGGCWFCPNQKIKEFAYLKTQHPDLYRELENFNKQKNKVSEGFKYGKTFIEIDIKVNEYIQNPPAIQLS